MRVALLALLALAPGAAPAGGDRALARARTPSRELIAPFDISKLWKKKTKSDSLATAPSAASLRAARASSASTAPAALTIDVDAEADASTVLVAFPDAIDAETTATVSSEPRTSARPTAAIPQRFATNVTAAAPDGSTSVPPTSVSSRPPRPAPRKTGNESALVWPVKQAATVDGDIILGGLMMVRVRPYRYRPSRQ